MALGLCTNLYVVAGLEKSRDDARLDANEPAESGRKPLTECEERDANLAGNTRNDELLLP